MRFKKWLPLSHPEKLHTFDEKLSYLKLQYDTQYYADLVDKYKVRNYVEKMIGNHILTKLYRHGDDPSAIPFDDLPNQYVIKYNHGSGYNIIVTDAKQLGRSHTIQTLRKRSQKDYRKRSKELQYKNIEKHIIIEEFLWDPKDILTYKLYNFGGSIEFIEVIIWDKANQEYSVVYDTKRNKLEFTLELPRGNIDISKPSNLTEMINYTQILSGNLRFCRVDFFSIAWKTIFSEITLTPQNWAGRFSTRHEYYDSKFGEFISLTDS